jgi:cell division septation protein DedD
MVLPSILFGLVHYVPGMPGSTALMLVLGATFFGLLILADISIAKNDPLYARSKLCKEATLDDSIAHCDRLAKLDAESEDAGRAAQLDDAIRQANAKLSAAKNVVAADGLAASLHAMFGFDEERTGRLHPIALSFGALLLVVFGLPWADSAIASARVQRAPRGLTVAVQAPPAPVQIAQETQTQDALPPPQPAPEPAPAPEEVTGETRLGQSLDIPAQAEAANLRRLPIKPVTPEQGVEQWARQVEPGEHAFADLVEDYNAYRKRRRDLPAVRYLGNTLRDLGYAWRKDRARGGKRYFTFPAEVPVSPAIAAVG